MAERKAIGKKKRFEIFKRDNFTCQYCGNSAPKVILEIDHIKPISKGGNNGYLNLVTACFDCNRGKRDKELSDEAVLTKQQQKLIELSEKREQMKMMLKWKEELEQIKNEQIKSLYNLCCRYMGEDSYDYFKDSAMLRLIRRYGFNEVYECLEISIETYFDGYLYQIKDVLFKLGGILYNRNKEKN